MDFSLFTTVDEAFKDLQFENVFLACLLFILLIVSFAIQRFSQLEAIPQVSMALGSCVLSYLVTTDKINIKEPSFLCFLLWVLCFQSQVKVLNVQLGFIYSVGVKFPCVYGDIKFFQHHCWKKSFFPLFVGVRDFYPISINSTSVSSNFELLFPLTNVFILQYYTGLNTIVL